MLRKLLRTSLLAAVTCVAFSSVATAQVSTAARMMDVDSAPATLQITEPNNPTSLQFYPNPTYGVVVNVAAPVSGAMILQVKPLFGPSAGQTLGFIYNSAYVAGSAYQHVLNPTVIKPGTYLVVGTVGGVAYQKNLYVTY